MLRAACALVIASAALAACGTKDPAGPTLASPTTRYELKVEQTPDRVALAPHAEGLSPAQRQALGALAVRWRDAGGGEVVVQSPAAGGETAARTASATVAELQAQGVDWIRIESYPGEGPSAPVVAGFARYSMDIPDCSKTWDDLSATGANRSSVHYGCSVTANMAAMIADPRHVLAPATMTPADAERRQTVLSNYRKGENTSSKKDEQASGSVSSAAK